MATEALKQHFRGSVRAHFTYPPETWRVEKIGDRDWCTVRPDGARMDRCPTKKAASEALTAGQHARLWKGKDAWLRGESRDPRDRQLEDWEHAIVAEILRERANHTAKFLPGTEPDTRPCIEVGGVQVYAYWDEMTGVLRVSVHLDEVEEQFTQDSRVPVRIKVQDNTVYDSEAAA
ncbi:hypothetical protein IU485_27855 [Nocardia cyriacigeorgica]|uniref:hypothetical protein n=1 Tax=Nocardia cyriacigeorgica TaxID=135487 RepID=UPI0018942CB3|nr:hypothetical protein [Nocardia cyriacigeorgica]MBF6085193.1 hypothetical protein [Nocardia cyriacigeorgica]